MFLMKIVNIVLKTITLGGHEVVPCALELRHINGPNTSMTKNRDL